MNRAVACIAMAYDPGAIDAALAAAVGDDAMLIAELRTAFIDSARGALAALEAARDERAWRDAAGRIRGLAASFGAVRLMVAASTLHDRPACDPDGVRRVRRLIARL